jgi:arylsulfatase A-like enzyme
MSGLYSPRHGIYTVQTGARGKEEHRKMIPVENKETLDPSYVTLGEAIKSAGYVTAHAGKWHLGSPGEAGPSEQGFDFNFGGNATGHPKGGYFSPYKNPELPDGPGGESLTDRLSADIDGFIRQHKNEPFFVYLPYYAVHTPIQAKKGVTAKYENREPHGGHKNRKSDEPDRPRNM